MAFVGALLTDESIDVEERRSALFRLHSDPGIPHQDKKNLSFWLKDIHEEFSDIQSEVLPMSADIVIIGSGITATSVLHTLLKAAQYDSDTGTKVSQVVMLEARDICDGATGRNGGHCLEMAEDYIELKERFGQERAAEILKFRLSHLNTITRIAEEYGIVEEAQVRRTQFLSAHFDMQSWKHAGESISAFKTDMPIEAKEWDILQDSTVCHDYHMGKAFGIIRGPAGALWPYKFVTSILSSLRKRHGDRLSIESNTPVTKIAKDGVWYNVVTDRGTIRCRHIVHCTNAHVSHLVPELLGRVYPVRGHMSAQSENKMRFNYGLQRSWVFNYKSGFDYLTQLPVSGSMSNKEMMFGGGFAQSFGGGIREIGISRDDELNPEIQCHLSKTLDNVFDVTNRAEGGDFVVKNMWAGTMGFSADGLPWVGKLPEAVRSNGQKLNGTSMPRTKAAEWTAAGFSGEGMVNSWLSGHALALMLLAFDAEKEDQQCQILQWFPEEMLITEKRLERSKLPKVAVDCNDVLTICKHQEQACNAFSLTNICV